MKAVADRRTLSMAFVPVVQPPRCFPYCVVWCPIPVLSWLLPFVGHMGICTSTGKILDFAASFYVSADAMAFGNPTRYWQLDPARASALVNPNTPVDVHRPDQAWDDLLQGAVLVFQQRPYNFLTGNCHSFVAHTLNAAFFDGSNQWSAVSLTLYMLWRGRSVGIGGMLKQWLPFVLTMALGFLLLGWIFLVGWACFLVLVAAWFIVHGHRVKEGSEIAQLPQSGGLRQAYSV